MQNNCDYIAISYCILLASQWEKPLSYQYSSQTSLFKVLFGLMKIFNQNHTKKYLFWENYYIPNFQMLPVLFLRNKYAFLRLFCSFFSHLMYCPQDILNMAILQVT